MAYTPIDKSNDYFTPYLWTGDGAVSRVFTGVGLQADMMWSKIRTSVHQHNIVDTVRGVNQRLISPNSANAEDTTCTHGHFDSLDADGFTITGAGGNWNVNASGNTYVGWNWKGGGTAVSNTDGSITSSVSANTTSGFSIVSYTGTGSNATVGHGLGVAPKVIFVKSRSNAENWQVYHGAISGMSGGYITLNNTDGFLTNISTIWNGNPDSDIFGVGTYSGSNQNTYTYIAYCFAEKKGFSKFGSYVGNGSADGTFVYTGFKPAFVMVKRTDTSGNWWIHDSGRNTYNVVNKYLFANSSSAEGTDDNMDFLSNGFKLRVATYQPNTSGGTYIYMAFAENPFVTSTGIPTPAR
jgi:hypothetical protein